MGMKITLNVRSDMPDGASLYTLDALLRDVLGEFIDRRGETTQQIDDYMRLRYPDYPAKFLAEKRKDIERRVGLAQAIFYGMDDVAVEPTP